MRWQDEYVLARKDQNDIYGPRNIYWRRAKTKKEARWGLEDIGMDEPDIIPLTSKEKKTRNSLSSKEREMWDIWRRLNWRVKNSKH